LYLSVTATSWEHTVNLFCNISICSRNLIITASFKDKPSGCSGIRALSCSFSDDEDEDDKNKSSGCSGISALTCEPTKTPLVVSYTAIDTIMQELEDDQVWINEFMRQNLMKEDQDQPKKKKVNKEKMKKDLFEIDFMCD